ncbi:hypothetical protein K501DRAFT_15484 [Backusella circina FSU 941]|nr:hypothetical protein K501DRAFT_15484 [Backusella circina FSU 941]
MSTNTEATTTTTTTVSTESQLNDVITSIYYARHHLDEIPPIKGKIEHLQNMLSSLEAEQTLQVASDSLETNLRQLKSELNHEIKEQERQEQAVINGIKSILQREQHNIINKVTSKSNVVSEFKNFCILLNSQVHKHGKAIQDALDSIGTSIAASFQFGHALSELQSTMIAEQGKLIATLNEHSRVDDIKRFEKLTSAANKLNIHEHLRQQTNTGIKEIKRINVELEAERKEAAAKETHIPEGIVQLLDELVTQPSVKQKLTERQQKYAEQLEAIFEHIKKETNRIVDLMAQHKFIMDDTRIWMDTFGLPEEEGCRDQETMMGAMKRALDDIADISHGMASKAKEDRDSHEEDQEHLTEP